MAHRALQAERDAAASGFINGRALHERVLIKIQKQNEEMSPMYCKLQSNHFGFPCNADFIVQLPEAQAMSRNRVATHPGAVVRQQQMHKFLVDLGTGYVEFEEKMRTDGYDTLRELRRIPLEDLLEMGMEKDKASVLLNKLAPHLLADLGPGYIEFESRLRQDGYATLRELRNIIIRHIIRRLRGLCDFVCEVWISINSATRAHTYTNN